MLIRIELATEVQPRVDRRRDRHEPARGDPARDHHEHVCEEKLPHPIANPTGTERIEPGELRDIETGAVARCVLDLDQRIEREQAEQQHAAERELRARNLEVIPEAHSSGTWHMS